MTEERIVEYLKKLCYVSKTQLLWLDSKNYRKNITNIDLENDRFITKNGKSYSLSRLLFQKNFIVGLLKVKHRFEPYLVNYELSDESEFVKQYTILQAIADSLKSTYQKLPIEKAIELYIIYFNDFYFVEELPFEQVIIKHFTNNGGTTRFN